MQTKASGRWSPRKALFVVVTGAALGWVAAIVSIYAIVRGMDGETMVTPSPTTIAAEDDFKRLSDIAPAAGPARGQSTSETPVSANNPVSEKNAAPTTDDAPQ